MLYFLAFFFSSKAYDFCTHNIYIVPQIEFLSALEHVLFFSLSYGERELWSKRRIINLQTEYAFKLGVSKLFTISENILK